MSGCRNGRLRLQANSSAATFRYAGDGARRCQSRDPLTEADGGEGRRLRQAAGDGRVAAGHHRCGRVAVRGETGRPVAAHQDGRAGAGPGCDLPAVADSSGVATGRPAVDGGLERPGRQRLGADEEQLPDGRDDAGRAARAGDRRDAVLTGLDRPFVPAIAK